MPAPSRECRTPGPGTLSLGNAVGLTLPLKCALCLWERKLRGLQERLPSALSARPVQDLDHGSRHCVNQSRRAAATSSLLLPLQALASAPCSRSPPGWPLRLLLPLPRPVLSTMPHGATDTSHTIKENKPLGHRSHNSGARVTCGSWLPSWRGQVRIPSPWAVPGPGTDRHPIPGASTSSSSLSMARGGSLEPCKVGVGGRPHLQPGVGRFGTGPGSGPPVSIGV